MTKQHLTVFLAISLVLNLLLGIALVLLIPRHAEPIQTEAPTASPTEYSAPPHTQPWTAPPTAVPTVPDPAETQAAEPPATQPAFTQSPTEPPAEYIGTLYTRQQLESLDNTLIPYGPGTAKNGDPAPYAGPAQDKYGKYSGHFIESEEDTIYLTFDCGYEYFIRDESGKDVALTSLILDTLKEKDVKAVFFVTMSYAQNNPGLVQRMIDEGHTVGNHSADHHSMPSLTIDQMVEQILELHNYVQANFGYTMHLFRPPSGEFSIRSLAVTQSLGYETVHWSFAYADWDPANQMEEPAALEKILSCHHQGAIYLLHAVSATNAAVLDDVIDGLRDLGYRLELLD